MNRWIGVAGLLFAILACADLSAPGSRGVRLSVAPVFDANGIFADNADRLRIRIQRDSLGIFVAVLDTTVAIDADGNASADLNVPLVQSPQIFRVLLDAVRSSDAAVLFSGSQDVTVTNTSGAAQEVQLPVTYAGLRGTRVAIAPRDTAVASGASFTFRATVFDAGNNPIAVPVGFYLVNLGDSIKLRVNRLTGAATAVAGQQGQVGVYALSADSLRDTTRVIVGATGTGARITPGYGNVGVGQTLQFSSTLVDPVGNPVTGGSFTWTSRSPAVATVNGAGLLTAAAPGTAVIVATAGSIGDSVLVTVPAAGRVVVSALGNGRSFRAPAVSDTVQVDIAADMRFTPNEKLGSYNARMTWDPSRLVFLAAAPSVAGDFSTPVVNTDSIAVGVLRFAAADPTGANGVPVLARFRFRALLTGAGGLALSVTEMSAPSPNFTVLSSLVTVTAGRVTVR